MKYYEHVLSENLSDVRTISIVAIQFFCDFTVGTVADGDQVSEFGQDAVAWAIDNGYLAQGGADVQPQTPVSRGRAVTIAVRYQPAKAQIVGAVK